MISISLLILLLAAPQEPFSKFSYCRESSRGPFELQCIDLNTQGVGEVRLKPRDAAEEKGSIALSSQARARFMSVLSATNFLADGDKYESNRKVADLGMKRLVIEMPSGRREAAFNFSTIKAVSDLSTFFDALINQEVLVTDIQAALQYERLSIPKRIEQVENELKANRIGDPERLIPVLERIESDPRLVNFARTNAARIKAQISAGLKPQ